MPPKATRADSQRGGLRTAARWSEISLEVRFWDKVDRADANGCWPWVGARHPGGYGKLWDPWRGLTRPAGQVSWELANGQPFPEGLFACHHCDNPPCVNPDHIFPGTQQENLDDARAKGRHIGAKYREFCKRGHPIANALIRKVGRSCRQCATLRMRGYRAARV